MEFEEHVKKLKIVIHKNIGDLAKKEGISMTPEAHLAIVEIIFEKAKMFGEDLDAFAGHAKRVTIVADDVRLLMRHHR